MRPAALVAAAAGAAAAVAPLPALPVERGSVTVSGLSSGGAFAVQFHVSWSSRVHGAAVLAAPPYWCANDNIGIGVTSCQHVPEAISVVELTAAAEYAATLLSIDALTHLRSSRVYIETGSRDTVVVPGVVNKTREWYEAFVPKAQVKETAYIPAEHCWPTDAYGGPCGEKGEPYIGSCGFDVAGEALRHLYGDMLPRAAALEAGFVNFDQTRYTPDLKTAAGISVARDGVAYVPAACNVTGAAPCRLHVAFHGCEQTTADIGDQFYRHVGLNEWAEANRIIVVYPQAVRSAAVPYNPKGCWDWFAYTGVDYATKLGPQVRFVKNIIDAVSGGAW